MQVEGDFVAGRCSWWSARLVAGVRHTAHDARASVAATMRWRRPSDVRARVGAVEVMSATVAGGRSSGSHAAAPAPRPARPARGRTRALSIIAGTIPADARPRDEHAALFNDLHRAPFHALVVPLDHHENAAASAAADPAILGHAVALADEVARAAGNDEYRLRRQHRVPARARACSTPTSTCSAPRRT